MSDMSDTLKENFFSLTRHFFDIAFKPLRSYDIDT